VSRTIVTEADLARADRLLEAVAKKSRKDIAQLLAEAREESLSCAMVRMERLMDVTPRKQPGLPFDEATELSGTAAEGKRGA